MNLIRSILGALILALDAFFRVKPLVRSPVDQARVDSETAGLIVYQFETCPFCVKVRRAIRRLSLRIELRDARNVPEYRDQLVKGGGEYQVPCLRIPEKDGSVRWMYESSDIVKYLEERFA